MKKITYLISIVSLLVISTPALAAVTTFKQVINDIFIGGILKPIVPFLIGLGVVVFIYGVLVLVFSEGGEKKEEGKQYMFWGIIGIFVMVSVWGLVNILISTFNLSDNVPNIEIKPIQSTQTQTTQTPNSGPGSLFLTN
jgi:hypothetical protein